MYDPKVPLLHVRMPRKSRRSQQATAQNTLGKRGFGSGLKDDDLMLFPSQIPL